MRSFLLLTSIMSYLIALALPAYYESSEALDGFQTFSGYECLLSPLTLGPLVFVLHFSWWANPLLALSLWNGLRRRDLLAYFFGILALLFSLCFIAEAHDPIMKHRIGPAYAFWLTSMALATSATLFLAPKDRDSAGARAAVIKRRSAGVMFISLIATILIILAQTGASIEDIRSTMAIAVASLLIAGGVCALILFIVWMLGRRDARSRAAEKAPGPPAV